MLRSRTSFKIDFYWPYPTPYQTSKNMSCRNGCLTIPEAGHNWCSKCFEVRRLRRERKRIRRWEKRRESRRNLRRNLRMYCSECGSTDLTTEANRYANTCTFCGSYQMIWVNQCPGCTVRSSVGIVASIQTILAYGGNPDRICCANEQCHAYTQILLDIFNNPV